MCLRRMLGCQSLVLYLLLFSSTSSFLSFPIPRPIPQTVGKASEDKHGEGGGGGKRKKKRVGNLHIREWSRGERKERKKGPRRGRAYSRALIPTLLFSSSLGYLRIEEAPTAYSTFFSQPHNFFARGYIIFCLNIRIVTQSQHVFLPSFLLHPSKASRE